MSIRGLVAVLLAIAAISLLWTLVRQVIDLVSMLGIAAGVALVLLGIFGAFDREPQR